MNVDLLAERRSVHCRALDMPTGSALTPRRFPENLAFLCGFPKREIERIALILLVFDTHAFVGVLESSAAEFAVAGETLDGEIHVASFGCVCVTFFDEFGHEVDDIVDIARCFEPYGRIVNLEFAHKFIYAVYHHTCVLERWYARFFGLGNDFVVDVRVVARVIDFVADFFKVFADNIVDERLIGVTYMRFARNRDSACVHIDLSLVKRHEIFFFSCERVVDFHIGLRPFLCLRFVRL